MERKRVRPDSKTFSTAIRACASSGDLQSALVLLNKMKNRYGLTPEAHAYSSMFNVCASAKNLAVAKHFFEEMHSSGARYDAVTITTIMDVYAECCNKHNARQYLKECEDLLEEMELKGVKANLQGFSTLLKLCARGSLTTEALEILDDIKRNGIVPNVVCYNTILDGILKDKKLSDEEVLELSSQLVQEMKETEIKLDSLSYNSLIGIAFKIEDLKMAIDLFSEMKKQGIKPTRVTYGIIIKCHEKRGDPSTGHAYLKPCIDLMSECQQSEGVMDVEGYTSLLSACAKAANLDIAIEMWKEIDVQGVEKRVFLYNAMLNVYISVKNIHGAVNLFTEMKRKGPRPDTITYSTMIKCYEKLGDPSTGDAYLKPCLDLFKECEQHGIQVDGSGYVSFLNACANVADLDAALNVWNRIDEQ